MTDTDKLAALPNFPIEPSEAAIEAANKAYLNAFMLEDDDHADALYAAVTAAYRAQFGAS
jgi:hypothetical protein